ncbi:MAG: hypothetical protein CK551_08480 [Planctomycetaceae bacterium]|nr:hypothetical protein [Gemmataceae bacterium]PHX62959.1 MAG: hypothetical protein CK551_08480 [Planctomycetaceae bacterium]
MRQTNINLLFLYSFIWIIYSTNLINAQKNIPNTSLLEKGDLGTKMVSDIGVWLDIKTKENHTLRNKQFLVNASKIAQDPKALEKKKQTLKSILGIIDSTNKTEDLELLETLIKPALIYENKQYKIFKIRWNVVEGLHGEGLLVEPKEKATAQIISIPPPDISPESFCGLTNDKTAFMGKILADLGCRVIVPTIIDRKQGFSNNLDIPRKTNIPRREFIYRMAYEMGYQINGLEIQKLLPLINWFSFKDPTIPIGVAGNGDGAFQALVLSFLDNRIQSSWIDGYSLNRNKTWSEPLDRNIWNYLKYFSDAELVSLSKASTLISGFSYPLYKGALKIENLNQAAPGILTAPTKNHIIEENEILVSFLKAMNSEKKVLFENTSSVLTLAQLGAKFISTISNVKFVPINEIPPVNMYFNPEAEERQQRQFNELISFIQKSWRKSDKVRQTLISKHDSSTVEKWEKSSEPLREYFSEEVIGKLPAATLKPNPRSRIIYENKDFTGYEVALDIHENVFAYGILLVPTKIKAGEKRPVVVCQHGLEGKPTDVCDPDKKTQYYNSFGAELARKGYIVFAPQNPYLGRDLFRELQRKANPLGLSLFSFIVQQHQITLDWLKTLPFVQPDKIGFYGLSYGGKTAMRVPAILKDYCLSICSGDFNEWVGKNVLVDYHGSYMWTYEYEMYEFNLGQTFNYAEMAMLIAPRPFMVERGHSDGVGIDEMVGWEYAKVRRFYAFLGIPEKTEIEFFKGGHEINSKDTFVFLKKHLGWPKSD